MLSPSSPFLPLPPYAACRRAPESAARVPQILLLLMCASAAPLSDFGRASSNVHRKDVKADIPFGSVIHFTNHSVAPLALQPWKVGDPQASTGTGFYLGDKTIVTNSHVVHDNTSLRLERHGQPGNFAGRVLCESELCDLALVTVDDEAFWEGVPAVQLQGQVPSLDDTVIAVGYPLGAKSVTVTRGVVSNVMMKDLSLEGGRNPAQLCVQIDAAINPGTNSICSPRCSECGVFKCCDDWFRKLRRPSLQRGHM